MTTSINPWPVTATILCFASSICICVGAQPPLDDPNSAISEEQVRALWEAEDFAELDALAGRVRETKARFWTGELQLPAFYGVFADFASENPDQFMDRVIKWRASRPKSIVAMVVAGEHYTELGEWSEEDSEGYVAKAHAMLQEARERAQKADKVYPEIYPALLYAAAIKEYEPHYTFTDYVAMLTGVSRANTVRDSALQQIFLEGQRLAPEYDHLYTARAITLLPTWNGVPGEVEAFAKDVAKLRPELYARIALEVFDYVTLEHYRDDHSFRWESINNGFQILLRQYPMSTLLRNWYARLAGAHGARETAAVQFRQLHAHWDEEVWDDQGTFQRWEAWARGEKPYPYHKQLEYAMWNEDHTTVKLVLRTGLDPNFTDESGWPILSLAAYWEDPALIDLLISHGADPAFGGESGETALHGAAYGGDFLTTKHVLSFNPPLDTRNAAGETALHQAAWSGEATVVELLLSHGADPAIGDDDGYTPLHVACTTGNSDMAKMLLNAGLNPNVVENDGWTALHFAAAENDVDLVRLLLDHRASATIQDHAGRLPIDVARDAGHTETVELLASDRASRTPN